ncbi:TPA: type III toxin-antitoxin system ToxN/AbiQ family toxin [Enterococcus faecalis]|nr:type III toxin-antitoxin system ToxN/AbiQ family toxin [Enterococcus faecalis]HAP3815513.1 type III toxin-antitoxin system ToxN/AbiQ family toxin [Enterococcus faecalis]
MKNSFSFYTVTDEYINYLREFESKVHYQYEHEASTYVGIVLKKNDFNYFVPLSSYSKDKPQKDINMRKRSRIVTRLFELGNLENPLGYLLHNNMIPVPDSELKRIDLDLSTPKHQMMQKQLIFMKDISQNIENKSNVVYRKTVYEKDSYYVRFSCDFKLLEAKATLYSKTKTTII